ncbi:MAG: TonB-dependent receptor [Holophagales bacterium]|nr:TonB-dependent receptor [Holophagales bacterium]
MTPLPTLYRFAFSLSLASAAIASAAGASGLSAFEGRVLTASGVAVEHAEIQVLEPAADLYSDTSGRFRVEQCALPCRLLVTHPRFTEEVVELREDPGGLVEVVLQAKQAVYERIDVTASRSVGETFLAETVATTEIRPDEKAVPPSSLTELVEGVAGVAENGQPGLFQVYSIRGVSRQRVMTLISGMQIVGERRAGVSTSFLDPLLMGAVDVLRGPASTHYGSGALGGVVQIFPRMFDGTSVELGWESFGNESYQAVGWGDRGWSIGFVRRDADDDEVSDGSLQDTHFTQYSATIQKSWTRGNRTWELLVAPSLGDDIGKPNLRFPSSRITNYPEEEHLLVKVNLASQTGWSVYAWAHPNSLTTDVLRVGSRVNTVENEAFDLGANGQREWTLGNGATLRLGLDYFGRRGVDSFETERSLGQDETTSFSSLDGGRQDELSAYSSLRWTWGATIFQSGARLTWQEQENGSTPSRDDSAWTGFLGLVRPVGSGWELTANVGSGLRFPNLSERFFTGTTGRGGTIGNPDLEPERSLNLDLGARWFGRKAFLSAQVFRLEIDDYIERIEVADDLLTFVNLISGTIDGIELEGFYQLSDAWMLRWSGHAIEGEADDGSPLADISADRVQLGAEYDQGRWSLQARWQHRFSKSDPGSGEVAIPDADLVSASVAYEVRDDLWLRLRGENLLDELYFASADDLASAAPGRSVGLGLSWSL